MSDPATTLAEPDPARCDRCGEVHPGGCPGHVEECTVCLWRTGNHVGLPCKKCGEHVRERACKDWPIKGGTICSHHGGRAPQVASAAARNLVEADAVKELAKAKVRPVGDPIIALGDLAGEVRGVLEVIQANAVGGTVDSPWMALLGDYIDRLSRILAAAGRLGLEQRRVKVEEEKLDLMDRVMRRAWAELGHDQDDPAIQAAIDVAWREVEGS